MKNLFEPTTANEIILRIQNLQPTSAAKWGKMTASQMLAHCQRPMESYFGERKIKRGLIGILFGKMAKKKLFSDKPWPQNLPTSKEFIVADAAEFEEEKQRLLQLINRFTTEGLQVTQNTHPFFGKMNSQDWAILQYRHLDHHLQQFGA